MSRACFETPNDGFADVIQGLGLRASLGDAAGNGRALRNEHAGLVGLQCHKQLHTRILPHWLLTMESSRHRRAGRRLAAR